MFLALYCHFNFLTSLFVLSGYVPSSALDIELLEVLEHASTDVLAAVICTVSSVPFPYLSCIFQLWHNHIHYNTSFNPSVKVRVCKDHIHLAHV